MARGTLGNSAGGKFYLFLYNIIQFVGWSYGLALFLKHVNSNGTFLGSWESISCCVTFIQTLQAIEVAHCVVGLVPSNALQTAAQISSRLVVVWGILRPVPESLDSVGLPMLMTAWSIAEATRCLYHALNIYNIVPYFITWCRYSFFILLYPIGVSGEFVAIITALPHIIRRNLFAIHIPKPINMDFSYDLFLYGFMLSYIYFLPKLYFYMLSQRKKFVGGDVAKKSK